MNDKGLGNIDIDEWLLDNNISTVTRIKIEGANRSDYLSDILEKFLKEQVQAIKQKERSKGNE